MEGKFLKKLGYFPFPFPPYDIQEQFMNSLYDTLESGKVGLFESPTGTVKVLLYSCPFIFSHRHQSALVNISKYCILGNAISTSISCWNLISIWYCYLIYLITVKNKEINNIHNADSQTWCYVYKLRKSPHKAKTGKLLLWARRRLRVLFVFITLWLFVFITLWFQPCVHYFYWDVWYPIFNNIFYSMLFFFQGKSLSLICGVLTWLRDYEEKKQMELDLLFQSEKR